MDTTQESKELHSIADAEYRISAALDDRNALLGQLLDIANAYTIIIAQNIPVDDRSRLKGYFPILDNYL